MSPKYWRNIVGRITETELQTGALSSFSNVFMHPQYSFNVHDNDIAILQFISAFKSLIPGIQLPVCIPQIGQLLMLMIYQQFKLDF